jgi:uncharacterized protein YbjT (DUF2867 family)
MQAAVIGGGASGDALRAALEDRGVEARTLSRSTGFDALRDDASAALRGMDIVVQAQGRFTTSARVATKFFTRTTQNVSAAVKEHRVARHIVLSILNCDDPALAAYGYYVGKIAQERLSRKIDPATIIVRSAQWHEFALQTIERLSLGPITAVPRMRIQPVALDAVAHVIAAAAVDDRQESMIEVAGPEPSDLRDMVDQVRKPGRLLVPVPVPGAAGRGFRTGAALPGPEAHIVGPTFRQWLESGNSSKENHPKPD